MGIGRGKTTRVKKAKKLTPAQKKIAGLTAKVNELTSKNSDLAYKLSSAENSLKWANESRAQLERDKAEYYSQMNTGKVKVHRLEKAVTQLKKAQQETLLSFDVLN